MMDYTELVKDLRGKFIAYDVTGNHNSAQYTRMPPMRLRGLLPCMKRPKWTQQT